MKPSLTVATMYGTCYVIILFGLVLRSVVPFVKRASRAVRDAFWTVVFARVAVTVVTQDVDGASLVAAQVLCRVHGQLYVIVPVIGVLDVPYADRGRLWAAGHDGFEVNALRAAAALAA